jgi:hypothetical protein
VVALHELEVGVADPGEEHADEGLARGQLERRDVLAEAKFPVL